MGIEKNISIQVWRVIAVLGVLIVHTGQKIGLDGGLRGITDFGKYGVQMFFIISAFLGYKSLAEKNSRYNIKSYYKNKCIRLLPLYYFCILIYWIYFTFIIRDVPTDSSNLGWFRYLFFLNGFIPSDTYFWFNLGITWTIPVFLFMYLIMPLIYKRINSLKVSIIFFVCASIIALVVEIFGKGYFMVLSYIPYFIEGIVIYFALKENKENEVCVASVVLAISLVVVLQTVSIDQLYSIAYSFLFVVLVLCSYKFTFYNKLMVAIIDKIDKYSYDIYLLQGCVIWCIIDQLELGKISVLLIMFLGTAILSIGVHHFIERPIQKRLSH